MKRASVRVGQKNISISESLISWYEGNPDRLSQTSIGHLREIRESGTIATDGHKKSYEKALDEYEASIGTR
ncbi:hypothetical protein CMI41_00435 [Candidatus Pacearchaeota archaeon]|jgi:hypothetical protein|nr:hypothetical protein [Candidatus Pacearchaeota archaeon]|tara:strand:+ start:7503 stop:7715 length:213 start_codon:yes stop_codon:yes gene_type:complete